MKIRMVVALAVLFIGLCAVGQEIGSNTTNPAASTAAAVPPLVQFSGIAKDSGGKPMTGTIGITFLSLSGRTGRCPAVDGNPERAPGFEGTLLRPVGRHQT